MQTIQNIIRAFLLAALAVVAATSCSQDEHELNESTTTEEQTLHQVCLHLDIQKSEFDGAATRSAAQWADGELIYLLFTKNGGGTVGGVATYDASASSWTVSYYGSLVRDAETKVEAYYFDAPQSASTSSVTLAPTTGVYVDLAGTYTYPVGGDLTVKASLKPATSRIRFRGTAGTSFTVESGIKAYTTYSVNDGTLATSTAAISLKVGTDGYTPYVYGWFTNASSPVLTLSYNDATYTAECPTSMFQTGESGWMNLPTPTSHNGWLMQQVRGTENGHAWVDLGLSVKWATMNVGASKAEDYGNYYAWGETTTKSTYNWNTYTLCNGSSTTLTKYNTSSSYGTVDNKTTLELTDDAAHVNWGGSWRMPTIDELDELRTKCSWTWTTQGGVNGYSVMGPNGNTLFLPAAGYRGGTSLNSAGTYGSYWSSSLSTSSPNYGRYLYFDSSDVSTGNYDRYLGRSVRAVCQ